MATFTAIRDMSQPSLILESLQEIGHYFYQECQVSTSPAETQVASKPLTLSGLPVSDDVYKNVAGIFRSLAHYLQNKADSSQKEKLGELLADSEILDQLCEGILHPFITETNQQEQREIKGSHSLFVVLLLHVCLMECSESSEMKLKLIKCGCIHLLMKELRNMRRIINTNSDSNKFCRQLIQTATLIVNNCLSDNVDLFMRLYPDTDIDGAFTSYFEYPDSIVRLVCQLTYYHFSHYLHHSCPGSIDCHETILDYTHLLLSASQSKHFVARVDKLFIDATDLLKVLQCLCISAKNRQILIESPDFHKAATNLLSNGGENEVKCVLNLLLAYLTTGQPMTKVDSARKKGKPGKIEGSRGEDKEKLLSCCPEIVRELESVLTHRCGDDKCLKNLCSSMLWYIQTGQDTNTQSCLLYVGSCYEHRHFGECCYWCDYIGELSATDADAKRLRDRFLLYKAKAKYFLYQRQHVILRRLEKLRDLGEMKQDRERVYENAREVISILGSLKSKQFPMDDQCEQFFDYALMDYVRELNKRSSKDCVYCMLCHRKQTMIRSHTIPESLLKVIFKEGRDAKMFLMGPSSLAMDSHAKTLHTVTFNMLCSVCDNEVLSQDENAFIENFAKIVYQVSPVSHLEKFDRISYGKWLHRFCAGMLFRNLALSRGVAGYANADDIHELFRYCRSVVCSSMQDATPAISQSPEAQKLEASKEGFDIAMFFTPGMHEDQSLEKLSNIVRTLNRNIFVRLSNISALGTTTKLTKKCYFFAVHFGIFTIVAFLEPFPTKYRQYLVDPNGGEFDIASNSDRLSLIPPGLLLLFEEVTEKAVKQYAEKLVEMNQDGQNVSLTVLKTSNMAKSQTGAKPTSFNLLPPKYELNRQTNLITIKEGHSILLHHTLQSSSASHTVFLAVDNAVPLKPYVILHSHVPSAQVSQTLGYYVSVPEFAFQKELDTSHKVFMQHIRAKDLEVFKMPAKLIPITYKNAGLNNYQSILYHLNRKSVFDVKCKSGEGCWYCCRKCDICMLDSTAGLSFSAQSEGDSQGTPTFRFHDEKCKAFKYRSREFPSSFTLKEPLKEVIFHILPSSSAETGIQVSALHLLQITLSLYDEKSKCPTQTAIDIYRTKEGNDELPSGNFVALFNIKTYEGQVFGEYFLTDELQLLKPLSHVKEAIAKDQIQLLNDVISQSMQRSGLTMKYICDLCVQVKPHQVQETDSDQFLGLDTLQLDS